MRYVPYLIVLLLSACAPQELIRPELTMPQNKWEKVRSYTIGEVQEATTGSPIVSLSSVEYEPAFTPVAAIVPPTPGTVAKARIEPLVPGQIWHIRGEMPGQGGYYIKSYDYLPADYAIHIQPDGTIGQGWVSSTSYRRVSQSGEWVDGVVFVPAEPIVSKGRFSAELLYSGMSGSTIRLMYREYTDDMARPAYAQELRYDLNESKTINFKSLSIEVLEAGNSKIRYRVLSDEDLPWLPVG